MLQVAVSCMEERVGGSRCQSRGDRKMYLDVKRYSRVTSMGWHVLPRYPESPVILGRANHCGAITPSPMMDAGNVRIILDN